MNKTATTLAKLALTVAQQRGTAMRARLEKAEAAAAANESMVRQLAAERVQDLRESAGTAPTRAQSEDMVREIFAIESMVRGVFAELKDELRGKDGENVKPEAVEATVRAVFAEMAPALKGKDGKTVKPEAVQAMVRAVFDEMRADLKGDPGASVDLVQVNAMVQQCLKDTPPALDARAVQALVRTEVQSIAPELRGNDGQPGLVWRGQWVKTAEYQPGDVVRHRGSSWVALIPVIGIIPGTSDRHWDLVARAGQDGGGTQLSAADSGDTAIRWTLANTAYPHFGYTHPQLNWKIEKINAEGTATVARPANNGGITYAAAWESRTTLDYAS